MLDYIEKRAQVYEVLITPIICQKRYKEIFREGNIIYTGQTYKGSADCDMSDFAIGFYEVIYQQILNGAPILNLKQLHSKELAGDTMNSFNTIANKTPGAGKSKKLRTPVNEWPLELVNYKKDYHCLANFWLLPMEIGRLLRGDLNKAKSPTSDYMDRFLKMVNQNVEFEHHSRPYFRKFTGWEDFVKKHFLQTSYVKDDLTVIEYSYDTSEFIEEASKKMKHRAKLIAESEYAEQLWDYFDRLKVLK